MRCEILLLRRFDNGNHYITIPVEPKTQTLPSCQPLVMQRLVDAKRVFEENTFIENPWRDERKRPTSKSGSSEKLWRLVNLCPLKFELRTTNFDHKSTRKISLPKHQNHTLIMNMEMLDCWSRRYGTILVFGVRNGSEVSFFLTLLTSY